MEITDHINRVYGVFKDFFGEDYVDLQEDSSDNSKFILVYWPRVRVTNEYGKYIDITDLYAKITVDNEGKIPWENNGFKLNRTSYTAQQFNKSYMHSHIRGIPIGDLKQFMAPCLGNGPIRHTITTLKNDSDSINWMLFCQELSLYVTVESLRGVPYIKLEYVKNASTTANCFKEGYCDFTRMFYVSSMFLYLGNIIGSRYAIRDFYQYYISHGHLRIGYTDKMFVSGMQYTNFMIDISNAFIDWINLNYPDVDVDRLYTNRILIKSVIMDGKLYEYSTDSSLPDYNRFIGAYVLTFKGERKYLSICNIPRRIDSTSEITNILHPAIALYILRKILISINFRFNETKNERTEETASFEKNRIYL